MLIKLTSLLFILMLVLAINADATNTTTEASPDKLRPLCYLKPLTGQCKAAYRRWAYNLSKGKCIQFIYGGCGGNKNRFNNKATCMKTCS
ncbi:kunitz-type serine protease inhibitor 2 [Scaptodrosophila lebanonensis]|uniref:Kunitz-type serine protease inhibitor 2 n=1 Tax=Drosophila lebanonensis TaxID=7225 RepID=A0A6J2TFN3_DROLE|nr:kunitz-type serine protease inhibitor 2 [Scaptodrosophila lebanonensis]